MRHSCGVALAVVVGLMWGGSARPDDSDKARAIIDKALQAMGGAKKLEKYKAATFKEEGTYYGMGEGLPYKGNYTVQGPDQFRMEIEGVFTIVLNGNKGWTNMGGETKEMSKDQLAQYKKERLAGWMTTVIPLRDKAFQVESLGASKVNKKPVVGVKVTRKDYPEVKLYFDKKTGLLARAAFRSYSPEKKKEVDQQFDYQDYQAVNGLQIPHKIVMKQDGKLFVEAKVKDWKATEKLDDKVFAKP